ncbi:MAG: pyridoxal-phosphate dependent enzyme [Cyanobacteriota bacterium]
MLVPNFNLNNMYLENINLEELNSKKVNADILRIDKIHEVVSGNKIFKLKYYVEDCIKNNYDTILTFGGCYSNHIVASAFAIKELNLKSIGVIRGEKPTELSHTLKSAQEYGMQLEFFSRSDYRKKTEKIDFLKEKFGDVYIIPEGGSGLLGIKGAKEILDLVDIEKYTHILCAMGTGTTYMGIVNSSKKEQIIIGIPVLKGFSDLLNNEDFSSIKEEKKEYCKIFYDYHFGGYAKKNQELLDTMNNFFRETNIKTDFVYTGKLVYAFLDLLKKDYFNKESNVLLIHSGGLQGNLSLKDELIFI